MTIVSAVPFTLTNGTIADATQVMADFNSIKNDVNTHAAANGANNDITSLAGLTTPLSVAQGGTAYTTAAQVFVQGYLFGLTISNNSGAPTTALDFAAGTCRDSTNADTMILASALTAKVLGTAWSVGNSGGLLDTGAIANNTYHLFLIKRLDTGVEDALASLSATAPTMPANYTLKRRIGSVLREGGAIVAFIQYDDTFYRSIPISDVNTTNPGTSAVLSTLSVPVGIVVDAMFAAFLSDTTPAAAVSMLLTAPAQADTTPSGTLFDLRTAAAGATVPVLVSGNFVRATNTSAQIRYRLDVSNADVQVRVSTNGWVDRRGRLS